MNTIDRFRPEYHFTPPTNWMNDPNGLVYFEGEWHLFYQYSPDNGPGSHWGHAVSTDLVRWEHLPIALEPNDLGIIASGSAVVDWHDTSGFFNGGSGLVAVFSQWIRVGTDEGDQAQCIAYSTDRGRTWTIYEGNPVLPNQGVHDFRDPKVRWHAPTNRWVMVVATFDRVTFYMSSNLRDWSFASDFGNCRSCWECPDLFELPVDGDPQNKAWVLNASLWAPNMLHFVGGFDGVTFQNHNPPDVVLSSTAGPDDYAAISWADIPASDGRTIWIGWMSTWRYARVVPTALWKGVMTVPRSLELRATSEGVRLFQMPVVELQSLRGPSQTWSELVVERGQAFRLPEPSDSFELIIEADREDATGLEVHVRKGEAEYTAIRFDNAGDSLTIDRSQSGIVDFDDRFGGAMKIPVGKVEETLRLHIFVDKCSVELFINDGATYGAALVFPSEASRGIELLADGKRVAIRRVEFYPLSVANCRSDQGLC